MAVRRNPALVVLACTMFLSACWAVAPSNATRLIVVNSSADSGNGTLRYAIESANASSQRSIIDIRLAPSDSIKPVTELPAIEASGLAIHGHGAWLEGGACGRSRGRRGCDGLVIKGPSVQVQELNARGFMFDGIAVIGASASGVVLSDCHCRDNLDDGIGITAGASGVLVEGCLLEGNGFRSKGKGVLVFDGSSAVLRGNTIRRNRDGVTVSRRSSVRLLDNRISANFDKGLGVSAASLTGSGNSITLNGLDDPAMSALSRDAGGTSRPPNGDGLRVGLGSRVELANTVISGNADAGVVVNDDSLLRLSGGRVTDNGSRGVVLHDRASVELRGVEVRGHGAGDLLVAEGATLTRQESVE